MFNLARIKDTIKVLPRDLGQDHADMIILAINAKYGNKIVSGVGLCVYVWDLVDFSEGTILYGDGCVYYKVIFRMVVFRPFKGECIEAIVKSQWKEGIRFTTHFFDDIWCDQAGMPQPTGFDVKTRRWYWLADPEYQDKMLEPGFDPSKEPEDDRFYWDQGEGCKIHIDGDAFNETAIPESAGPAARKDRPEAEKVDKDTVDLTNAPYVVYCSMKSQGLGPLALWPQGDAMDEDE